MRDVLHRYARVFTDVPKRTDTIECSIKLTSDTPVKSKPHRVPYEMRETMRSEIKDMLELGIIERSESSYASPCIMVRKPDGKIRFVIDFRRLNRSVVFDSESMLDPDVLFTEVAES